MITPVPWLERNPTYKDQIEQLSSKDLSTFGFLGYPVLQAADIIMYKPYGVPVGVDQAPHVEITREIARRFNYFYGPVFPEPEVVLTADPEAARDRPAQDEQELRQRHLPVRLGRDGRDQGGHHDHRPAAHAQERPGQPGHLQRVRLPQALLAGRGDRGGEPALSHGRHRVRGVQEADGQAPERLPGPDPRSGAVTTRSAPSGSRRSSRPGSDKARETACRTMEEVRAAIKL